MDTGKLTLNNMIVKICLIITLLTTHYHQSLSDLCHRDDKNALLRLKKGFNNPQVFHTWDPLTDCCRNWSHVSCDMASGRVNSLHTDADLDITNDLSGAIPPAIGDLSFLEVISFSNSPNLTGPLPRSITKLRRLRFLVIVMSRFSGPVPSFLTEIKSLAVLDFSNNNLSGKIPDFLSEIKSLAFIDFSNNNFAGPIPASLSSLPKLTKLTLSRNKLTGPIPRSFGDFRGKPFYLDLSHNRLSGKIPASLGNKGFDMIDLSWNRLEGDASLLFGAKKATLTVYLSRNLLEFDLSKVKFPENMTFLYLDHNKIFGSIPDGLARLEFLRDLNVSHNRLCGRIPLGGSLQTVGAAAYSHNRCLCGPPLKNQCRKL